MMITKQFPTGSSCMYFWKQKWKKTVGLSWDIMGLYDFLDLFSGFIIERSGMFMGYDGFHPFP